MGQNHSNFRGSASNLINDQILAKFKPKNRQNIAPNDNVGEITNESFVPTMSPIINTKGQYIATPINNDTSKGLENPKCNDKEENITYPSKLATFLMTNTPQTVPSTNTVNDQKETFDDHTADIDEKQSTHVDVTKYGVDYKHIHLAVTDFIECSKTDDSHSGLKLLEVFDSLKFSDSECQMWQLAAVSKGNGTKDKMRNVVDFAENNSSCSPDVKSKLRVITKLILESKSRDNYKNILLLIASHGHVCNVMKEVAINDAYALMTNNLNAYIESQSLQQQILKVLRDYRILLVEQLFHEMGFSNNTHYIAGFHNEIAPKIGIKPYNDPDISHPSSAKYPNWRNNLDKRYLKTLYTKENMLKWIVKQMEEKKIAYQKVVQFFEKNCPKHMDCTAFLGVVIDIDTGKINKGYLCWMLEKLGVFLIKDDNWSDIDKCWEDAKV